MFLFLRGTRLFPATYLLTCLPLPAYLSRLQLPIDEQ